VWHASGKARKRRDALGIARAALAGIGDARLGEWTEDGAGGVVHVRRRLAPAELELAGIGPEPRDVRGTPEERERLARLVLDAPHLAAYLPLDALARP
jgi:hypothetical protein